LFFKISATVTTVAIAAITKKGVENSEIIPRLESRKENRKKRGTKDWLKSSAL